MSVCVVATFFVFAIASTDDVSSGVETTRAGDIETTRAGETVTAENNSQLGDYEVEIKSARITTDYSGNPTVVVTYGFTNNADSSQNFFWSIDDKAFQDGIELTPAFLLADGDPYDPDMAEKDIQKGVSIDIEVAYILSNSTSDVVVEVSELISFSDKKITKTFSFS